jgi:beta-glucosidase
MINVNLFSRTRCIIYLCTFAISQLTAQLFSVDAQTEEKIDSLLAQMTLAEKAGQMTQVTFQVIAQTDGEGRIIPPGFVDEEKLNYAVADRHVGSVLNIPLHAFTVEEWHDAITAIQDAVVERSRLGIPILYGIDAIHGANYTMGATLFPQSINLAATWNPDYVEESARITAREVRASGIRWNFNPVLDTGRQPLWPRFWETYGEDPYLAAEMGGRYVRGLQSGGEGDEIYVAACPKHYFGYGHPWSGKDRTPAIIDERTMNDWHLPIFREGIKAGAATVMGNSSEVNGIPGHANYHFITEILKEEWGFQGFFVSDWRDVNNLHVRDRVAETPKDAVCMAVNAGVDMSMVPFDFSFSDYLQECVRDGSVTEERINDAVRRILRVKFAVGLFDDPYPDGNLKELVGTEEANRLNRKMAGGSIVLAKNTNNVLPLARDMNLLVTGPTGNLMQSLNGGWTITWQGNDESLYPEDALTIVGALIETAGEAHITYVEGAVFEQTDYSSFPICIITDIDEAVRAAERVDAIILTLGEPSYCESEGNIDDLTIDDAQIQLANAMIATGKPVILVLAQGRPRTVSRFVDNVDAVLIAGLPGMEGGRAIADILYGDVNPSAKLPYSYPRTPNALTPYDHKPLEEHTYNPQWEFGHGLSYTTFEYSDLRISRETLAPGETMDVSVRVTNTGNRTGKEVVHLYVTDLYGQVSRPVRQLKRFQVIELEPGESKDVKFQLDTGDLEFTGLENKRIFEPGMFEISVNSLHVQFEGVGVQNQ